MEVNKLKLPGCMQVVLGVFTLGVAPLAIWIGERSWPKVVDEQGLQTRGGKHFSWTDFTQMKKVITRVSGGSSVEHFQLQSLKGKVIVPVYRLQNGQQVLDYIWQHLPEQARLASQA